MYIYIYTYTYTYTYRYISAGLDDGSAQGGRDPAAFGGRPGEGEPSDFVIYLRTQTNIKILAHEIS